ncbi:hypothetical protein HanRHA438_Chr14g0673521 [Helianthus annuus]|uniref:Uncharacterized protein n=1 Tax=Helianthus annuus TaxID=4232 RepID=A0A9K3H9D3_HELAN|nr:hypothetical protein HanXRQr2_Chr14g0662371 [Helianthus annuus]KAJ0841900.1 hypothetical protein HanPSC8_Chr14g0635641 [Helianthus annuus]KAJ0855448.1 hypothetical protein HanRHA438_Chr14g0673521 [Helianthus annuus]
MNSGDIPVNQSFRPRRWGERQWFSVTFCLFTREEGAPDSS